MKDIERRIERLEKNEGINKEVVYVLFVGWTGAGKNCPHKDKAVYEGESPVKFGGLPCKGCKEDCSEKR